MSWRWSVVLLAAGGVGANLVLWLGGERTFVTHPVSVLALALATTGATWLAGRVPAPVHGWLVALASSLAALVLLGAWASATPTPLAAGLWSVAWVPVNALLAVVGLSLAGLERWARTLAVGTAVATLAGAFLVRPVVPFAGIETAAPEAWTHVVPYVAEVLLAAWNLALVAATVAVALRARRASVVDRGRLARAAAVTSCAPCLVVCCYALAVLRSPGDVDPTAGSVAYTVAIGMLAALVAWAASSPDRVAVRVIAFTWAAAAVVLLSVGIAGPTVERQLTLGIVAVAVVTVGVLAATAAGLARYEHWSHAPAPRPVTAGVPGLSPRENDVLAAMAGGATNAAIAGELFLSERTVEQHLRSIFDKLDLGDHGGSNRRVRAAATWWQHQDSDRAAEA
ncbi:LuxR C-terminal-related transcriptional regulator [Nocardioides oleivorans]|nr:LuxR C-terminal-related transcriptional regulator [Nocardioides oleivorans]